MTATSMLIALSLGLTACGGDDDDSSSAATTGGGESSPADTSTGGDPETTGAGGGECPADQGGEFTFGVRNEPPGFDTTISGTWGVAGGHERTAIFDTLMAFDPDTGEFEPRLAESLESNEDLTEWTLTLRDEAEFGNGEPVDTAAVQFTVDRHAAPKSLSLFKPMVERIERMEIVDDTTMVFHLNEAWGNFPSLLAGSVGMVIHPGTFERLGQEGFSSNPQGGAAGPYELERWSPGEVMVMKAKDNYWAGTPCLETLRFVRIEENAARYEAFVNGEVDGAFLRSPREITQARDEGFNLSTQVSNGGFLLQINSGGYDQTTERPGADVRVRRAIALAIDPDVIDQRVFDGEGIPSKLLVPEESLLYTDDLEPVPYDVEEASALLQEVMDDTGYDGSLHFVCNTTYEDASIAIQGLLEAAGFTVDLDNQMSVQEWSTRMGEDPPDFDLSCNSLLGSDARPWASLLTRIGDATEPTREFGYANPEMADALVELRESATLEEQQAALVGVQEVWNETVPSVVYGHVEEGVVWSDEFEGLEFTRDMNVFYDGVHATG